MRNKEGWVPSKFIYKNGRLIASRNPKEVQIGSRLYGDLLAYYYDTYIKQYVKGNLTDLGCGKVPLYATYKDFISNNICVDWTNTQKGEEYLDFECNLNVALPFPDEEFDTIILSDVLEHIAEPIHLWRELSRILVKGGKIMISVPFYYPLHESPFDYYRYTEHSLQYFAHLTGLQILLLSPIGGSVEVLADILAKHLQYLPILGSPLAIVIQNIALLFKRTPFGRKIYEKTGKAFPLGYFLIVEKPTVSPIIRNIISQH